MQLLWGYTTPRLTLTKFGAAGEVDDEIEFDSLILIGSGVFVCQGLKMAISYTY
jgi:hypothetical protein